MLNCFSKMPELASTIRMEIQYHANGGGPPCCLG
jgi:hypothetical protein